MQFIDDSVVAYFFRPPCICSLQHLEVISITVMLLCECSKITSFKLNIIAKTQVTSSQ